MIVGQSFSAVAANVTSSFLASGGTAPYVYAVRAGGAGGTINSVTGLYLAPAAASSDPKKAFDIIDVTDNVGARASLNILVGTSLLLFCDIIAKEMDLPIGRVVVWDQKIFQPTDEKLYVAVKVLTCKPFANTNKGMPVTGSFDSVQSINMYAQLQLDIISRGPEARDRKEEMVMALASNYAQSQQEANSFFIGKIPAGGQFINLSSPDGAAIPYRFNISVGIQYFVTKVKEVPFMDTFETPVITTEP